MSESSSAGTALASSFATHLEARVSERMRRIVDFAIPDRPTWDLCCDHGLIGLWAWHVHDLPELHFVDRAPRLVGELRTRIAGHIDLTRLFFHQTDASQVEISPAPSNLLIGGVGFRAAERIVSNIDPTRGHRVVVSVHAEADQLPRAMNELGWVIAGEATIEERGRRRSVFAWDGPL